MCTMSFLSPHDGGVRVEALDTGIGKVYTEVPSPTCGNPGRSDFAAGEFDTVFACGDFHGDYAVFQACMLMTGCVRTTEDHGLRWIPSQTRKAITMLGDLVDRQRGGNVGGEFENEEHLILRMANKLTAEAERAGSAVFRLVGNHEIIQADVEYSNRGDYVTALAQQGGLASRTASFTHGQFNREIRACSARAIVKIGPYVFVHGGINASVVDHADAHGMNLLDGCNTTLREYLWSGLPPRYYARATRFPYAHHFLPLLYNIGASRGGVGPHGVLWDDELSRFDLDVETELPVKTMSQDEVEDVVAMLNDNLAAHESEGSDGFEPVTTIVVAHTAQLDAFHTTPTTFKKVADRRSCEDLVVAESEESDAQHGVNVKYEGRVWCIDIGQSRAFGPMENPSILIIDMRDNTKMVRRWKTPVGNSSFIA